MRILMEWAKKHSKEQQFNFAEYYHYNYLDVINDESLGGRMDESTVTRQMMKKIIVSFEIGNNLVASFADDEIHQ